MSSPFPGMDPFIEQPDMWMDFHNSLATEIQGQLNSEIQPKYFAGLNSYVTYEVIDLYLARPVDRYAVRPDVDIWQAGSTVGVREMAIEPFTPAPVKSAVPMEVPMELLGLEIRMTTSRQLVTVIEILSPVNKRPGHPALDDYLRKRGDILRSGAHFVEIDLLRGGQRPPLMPPVPVAPYYVLLSRMEQRPRVDLWPIQLSDPLPVLPVPLLAPDPDVPLDLGAAVRSVYTRGAYATRINYTQPPPPPVDPVEAVWIDERLRAEGRR
jgi:hypothetical protein